MERFEDGPLLAVLAVQTLKPRQFRLGCGLRLLKWEWDRGTFRGSSLEKSFRGRFRKRFSTIKQCFFFQPAPVQVLNEVRNALAHLSRIVLCDTLESAKKELDRAESHLQRAERDGYKILAIYHHDALLRLGRIIHSKHHFFPNQFYKEYNHLVIRRKEISIIEHGAATQSAGFSKVASEYQDLAKAAIKFAKKIEDEYKITWLDKIWYSVPIWGRRFGQFSLPFFITLLTCLLVENYTCQVITTLNEASLHLGVGSVLSERCKNFTMSEPH